MQDWYEEAPSTRWNKQLLTFKNNGNTIFVEATEFGDVLALSSAPYLQGIDERFDGDIRFDTKFKIISVVELEMTLVDSPLQLISQSI